MSNKAKVYPQYNGVNPKYVELRNKCNEIVTYKSNCDNIKECGSRCIDCVFWVPNDPDSIRRRDEHQDKTGFKESEEIKSINKERKSRNNDFPISKRLHEESADRDSTVLGFSELSDDLDKKRSVRINNKKIILEKDQSNSFCNIYGVKTHQFETCKSFRLKGNVSNG